MKDLGSRSRTKYVAAAMAPEFLDVRIKDVVLAKRQIRVRDGKGRKNRVTVLPASLVAALAKHVDAVRDQHERDVHAAGAGYVALPDVVRAKYPTAPREWPWQWLFPATRTYVDRETGERRRHHRHESAVQRAIHAAARAARIPKLVSCPRGVRTPVDHPP